MILPFLPTLVEGASKTDATDAPITSEDTNSFEMEYFICSTSQNK